MIDPQFADGPVDVTNRTLRQFAGLWLLVFGGLAWWSWFNDSSESSVFILATVAAIVGVPGLIVPGAIRPLFSLLMTITFPIGWVVSHLILGLLFFGVFTPVALVFKVIGRDALARRRQPGLQTYWAAKPMPTDMRSYFNQS